MNKDEIVKPKILSGFMELLPRDQIKFNNMIEKIRKIFESYGFLPMDTVIIELSEVLLAKAGGETEKQVYRFNKGENDLSLRFDLTVPLARYVSQNINEIKFPFKRYQIGKVFRGERPQKGRFREFYQFDIDVIGEEELSVYYDAEMPSIIFKTFKSLGFNNFTIRINNRKLLSGFLKSLELENRIFDILRFIDKIDKIGCENVEKELINYGVSKEKVNKILEFILISGNLFEVMSKLKSLNCLNDSYLSGIEEIEKVSKFVKEFGVDENYFKIDLTIARGLDYYTGTVYETILNDYPDIGSVCSGGRYDNLASHYTTKKLPGVGISIGLTRLFYQLNEIGLLNDDLNSTAQVMIAPLSEDLSYSIKIANYLRENGVNTEIFFQNKNFKTKMKHADKIGVKYVVVLGEDEESQKIVTVKNMLSGIQISDSLEKVIEIIKLNK